MQESEARAPLRERVIPVLAGWLLRAIGATLRVEVQADERLRALLAEGKPVILYGWHGSLLVGAYGFARYRPYVMISQSRDGERIARTVERLGFRPVRGSSSRGGVRALLQMVRLLEGPVVCAHLVDGPRGPRGEVKPGLVLLAQRSGATLIGLVGYVTRKWVAKSWDRMQVPLPFARVVIRHLPERTLPAELSSEQAEAARLEIEAELRVENERLEAEEKR